MFKLIVPKIIIGSSYLALYAFIRFVILCPEELSVLLLVLFLLTMQPILEKVLSSIGEYFSPVRERNIIKALKYFENRLKEISNYHEILPEFYHLFNILFPRRTWVFYVFEKSSFQIIKYDTSKVDESLPEEIKFHVKASSEPAYIFLNDSRTKKEISQYININLFLKHDLSVVIPIRGKSQIVALIFTEKLNLEFFKKTEIAQRAERVLLRAGQILENTALYLDVVQRNLEIKKIFEVSQKLLTSMKTEEILEFLLDALAQVVPFDAGVIFLFDPETKKLFKKVSKGYDEEIDLTLKMGQGACGWVG